MATTRPKSSWPFGTAFVSWSSVSWKSKGLRPNHLLRWLLRLNHDTQCGLARLSAPAGRSCRSPLLSPVLGRPPAASSVSGATGAASPDVAKHHLRVPQGESSCRRTAAAMRGNGMLADYAYQEGGNALPGVSGVLRSLALRQTAQALGAQHAWVVEQGAARMRISASGLGLTRACRQIENRPRAASNTGRRRQPVVLLVRHVASRRSGSSAPREPRISTVTRVSRYPPAIALISLSRSLNIGAGGLVRMDQGKWKRSRRDWRGLIWECERTRFT
jgi:hypothetical protein